MVDIEKRQQDLNKEILNLKQVVNNKQNEIISLQKIILQFQNSSISQVTQPNVIINVSCRDIYFLRNFLECFSKAIDPKVLDNSPSVNPSASMSFDSFDANDTNATSAFKQTPSQAKYLLQVVDETNNQKAAVI